MRFICNTLTLNVIPLILKQVIKYYQLLIIPLNILQTTSFFFSFRALLFFLFIESKQCNNGPTLERSTFTNHNLSLHQYILLLLDIITCMFDWNSRSLASLSQLHIMFSCIKILFLDKSKQRII